MASGEVATTPGELGNFQLAVTIRRSERFAGAHRV